MFVETNGGRVFAAVDGNGPPILIPGYASVPAKFEIRAAPFRDQYTVISCDVRGEGLETQFPPGPYTMSDLADDTVGVLDALGYDRVHYIGSSHTGMLGLEIALRHPDRIDRLVLTSTNAGLDRDKAGDHALPLPEGEFTDAFNAADKGPDGVRQVAELMFSTAALEQNPSLVELANESFGRIFDMPEDERAWCWAAYGDWDARDRLGEVTSRTLVVSSDSDRMVAVDEGWALYRGIPKAVFVALNGVGHSWLDEAPGLVGPIITSFFRGEMDPPYE